MTYKFVYYNKTLLSFQIFQEVELLLKEKQWQQCEHEDKRAVCL